MDSDQRGAEKGILKPNPEITFRVGATEESVYPLWRGDCWTDVCTAIFFCDLAIREPWALCGESPGGPWPRSPLTNMYSRCTEDYFDLGDKFTLPEEDLV